MILCTKQYTNKQFSNNTFQTPDSKKDKSLTPKTPKVPLSLEEIKAKMQASIDKVSFLKLQVSSPLFIILVQVQQKNVDKISLCVTACSLVSRVNWCWSSEMTTHLGQRWALVLTRKGTNNKFYCYSTNMWSQWTVLFCGDGMTWLNCAACKAS